VLADRVAPTPSRRDRLATSAAVGSGETVSGSIGPAALAGDALITRCATAVGGPASAEVVVTNHGPETANYLVTIDLATRSGVLVGAVNVIVNNLAPGQSTSPWPVSVDRVVPPGGLVCRAGSLTRTPTGPV
jgi:hypothetical protein